MHVQRGRDGGWLSILTDRRAWILGLGVIAISLWIAGNKDAAFFAALVMAGLLIRGGRGRGR